MGQKVLTLSWKVDECKALIAGVLLNSPFQECVAKVGRCRFTVSEPVLKAPMVSALDTIISQTAFILCIQFPLAPLH
jgi:hypothetical protein